LSDVGLAVGVANVVGLSLRKVSLAAAGDDGNKENTRASEMLKIAVALWDLCLIYVENIG
jgi:hypothetical protein